SRKDSTASSYWKLCNAVRPRRNAGCAEAAPELGKRIGGEASSRTSANAVTAPMLASASVSLADATRRRFLGASAAAAVGTLFAAPAETRVGLVPFVGEGGFPLETTVGAGL